MNRVGVSEVLARANAALVGPDLDLTGALASLLSGTIRVLPADAAAMLVDCDGRLEVLAATSHQAAEIELHQAQAAEGPCLDALRSGRVGGGCGAHVLADLWPLTGPAIIRAGYQCVMAIPLRWQGTTYGALNVFRRERTSSETGCPSAGRWVTRSRLSSPPVISTRATSARVCGLI